MSVARVKSLAGEAHFFEETINIAQVKKLLDNHHGPKSDPGKIEGMKWLLAQISKGRDVSQFFASVVKIVVTKSVELKKMVYMFLVNYVDSNKSCRELALLAINSFQKDLADSNQLIRALALRVLTSFRVPEICQIQLMAVKKCAGDRSPYVRKTSAHSIPKLYAMDKTVKDQLIQVIEKLFEDRETMVIGSAVAAYSEVCPERHDLFHPHFRKLCHLLADVDEWGQIVIMEQLLRYARTQFLEPPERQEAGGRMSSGGGMLFDMGGGGGDHRDAFEKPVTLGEFYDDDEETSGKQKGKGKGKGKKAGKMPDDDDAMGPQEEEEGLEGLEKPKETYDMDKDHKLLLRSALPLLKSRNAGVTLAVATLYFYLGSGSPTICSKIGRALVREMRSHREIAFIILQNIAQMCERWPNMFRPELKEFYVNVTDPSFIRDLKLRILGLLANKSNVTLILRELQQYCRHSNKSFVVATVHTVGAVAQSIRSVSEQCLRGLMALVKSNSEAVVAAAVIVIRRLLQQNPTGNAKAVKRLVRLLEKISVPAARASIVWIVGEFSSAVREYAPDTLRKLAKGFREEAVEVKFQILNLALKLWLQTHASSLEDATKTGDMGDGNVLRLLFEYVLQLAKFDMNFDLRDRARLVSGLLLSGDEELEQAMVELLGSKAAIPVKDNSKDSENTTLVLGSLSQIVGHPTDGYSALPPWTLECGDPALRSPATDEPESMPRKRRGGKKKKGRDDAASGGFYSNSDGSDDDESGSDDDDDDESGSEYTSSSEEEESGSDASGSDGDGSSSEEESSSGDEGSSDEGSSSEEEEAAASGGRRRPIPDDSSGEDDEASNGSGMSSSGDEESSEDDGSDSVDDSSPKSSAPRNRRRKTSSSTAASSAPVAPAVSSGSVDLFDLFDSPAPPAPTQSAMTMSNQQAATMADGDGASSVDPLADFMGLSIGAAGGVDDSSSSGNSNDLMGASLFAALSPGSGAFDLGPGELQRHVLVPASKGHGLEVSAIFLRTASAFGEKVNDLQLVFQNTSKEAVTHVRLRASKSLPPGVTVTAAPDFKHKIFHPGDSAQATMHVDFSKGDDPIKFTLYSDKGRVPVVLKAPLGELLKPAPLSDSVFEQKQKQMSGMQEANCKVKVSTDPAVFNGLPKRVLRSANVAITIGSADWMQTGKCRFVGRRPGTHKSILFTVEVSPSSGAGLVRVNCESAMLSTMFLRTLRTAVLQEA